MIKKINMIVLIFLTIFLISTVSATELENKTLTTESTQSEYIHIETNDIEMYYKDGTRFAAEIHDENMAPLNNTEVSFNLNNMTYSRKSDENGQASIAINLNSGKYNVTTKVNEISVNNSINIKSTVYGSDVFKIYRNSTQYYAEFLDINGETLKNTEVNFNINGVFYKRTTNESGIAKLNLNLGQGEYILTAINPKNNEMASNIVTILPNILNNRDIVKYYRNDTKYSVTLLEKNGETSKAGKEVVFNINGIFYKRQTNDSGIASLNLNLNPGEYIITAEYEECKVSNNIKILPTLITNDLIMSYKDGTTFNAYLIDGSGQPKAYDVVTFNINGILYKRTTNESGIAKLSINLQEGDYIITSENNDLKVSNNIKISAQKTQEIIKNTNFTYEIKLPNYVNITFPYVFENSFYSIKSGINGIIRIEKNQLFEIEIGNKIHIFSTSFMPEYSAKYLGSEYWLLPFDNSPAQHNYKLENLTGNGIILYRSTNFTHFIYRNNCSSNIEQFGAYIDKFIDNSEIINYIQNGENIAKIKFQTMGFDEIGLKYTLSKYYGKMIYDFEYKSYSSITNGEIDKIKFAKTNESVIFDYFGKKIVGILKEEDIMTKFNSENCIEFEKSELITYGLSDKYKGDFDVLQSFTIINKKISDNDIDEWINKEVEYKSNVRMQSIYTMFLTSLNTAYLSDKLSDNMTMNTNMKWSRTNNTVILGSMNWKETFMHILTPDMGRSIQGDDESDIINFRFVNSILLSKIEQNSLLPIAQDAEDNITSVFDDIFNSLKSFKTSIVFYNNTAIISDECGNSSFVIDLNTGLVTPLFIKDDFAYKGISVTRDCGLCSINSMMNSMIHKINNGIGELNNILNYIGDNIQPLTSIAFKGTLLAKGIVGALIGGSLTVGLSLIGTATSLQSIGVYIVDNYLDEKDKHATYDHITFTRPGYLQNTKIYNIPKEDGSVDYLEIPIKKDNSLDRDNVKYISNGNVRILTKQETYDYFNEETWDPFNVPQKYWR